MAQQTDASAAGSHQASMPLKRSDRAILRSDAADDVDEQSRLCCCRRHRLPRPRRSADCRHCTRADPAAPVLQGTPPRRQATPWGVRRRRRGRRTTLRAPRPQRALAEVAPRRNWQRCPWRAASSQRRNSLIRLRRWRRLREGKATVTVTWTVAARGSRLALGMRAGVARKDARIKYMASPPPGPHHTPLERPRLSLLRQISSALLSSRQPARRRSAGHKASVGGLGGQIRKKPAIVEVRC